MAQTTEMRKVTFSLPAALVEELREVVESGMFRSQNSLVRAALEKELKRVRDAKLRRELEEAMRDPLFLRDLQETAEAFQFADAETAGMLPDD